MLRVLFTGVTITLLTIANGYAQTPDPASSPATGLPEAGPGPAAPPAPAAAGEASTERVVVTGSYIPTAEEVTASPLDTLTTQEVARAGTQDVLNVLQKRNPDFNGAGNLGSTNANIASGTTNGGAIAQIRGFPTLILYEGRRIADAAAIATAGAQFSDVSLFPAALIGRIEVLKDGASALYGSEAVGGVINIFTKDDFQGAEVGFRYGTTIESGTAERRGYAIAGVGNGTTQVTAGMQYYEIDPLYERERAYSVPSVGLTTTFGGGVRSTATAGTPDGRYIAIGFDPLHYPGAPVANSPFDVGAVPGSIGPGAGFAALPQFYRPSNQAEFLNYDISKVPTSTLDSARTNAVASASHQVFGKKLELFGNFLYSNSDTQLVLNAQPVSTGGGVIIPAGRVGLTDVDDPNYDPDPVTGNSQIYNPFNYQIDSTLSGGPNRTVVNQRYQQRPRIYDVANNFYRLLGGIRSQVNENWMVEAAGYYSKYDTTFTNSNLLIVDNLNALIAGTAVDPITGKFIPALDFFALNPIGTGPGQVAGNQFDTAFGTNIRSLSSFQRVFDAKVVGFPFSLPGGKVGLSLGGEYRVEGFKVEDSPEIFLNSTPIAHINKKRDIASFFAEVSVPIVSPSMNVPLVHSLEVNFAGRYDHYQHVAEDAKVPKLSLRYQPIKDLTVRATYSDSFVAPNLYQLFGPPAQGSSTTIRLNGVVQDQAAVLVLSNPGLTPSTAETYTAGMVYSPSFIPGLVITADYFRTLQLRIVAPLGGAVILGSVENLGTASPFIDLVAFNNFPGQPGATPITGPGQLQGELSNTFYIDQNQNTGAARNEGFDLSARYNLDLKAAGQLELGLNAVVFTKSDLKTSVNSHYYNILGLDFPEGGGAQPDYKLTALAEYRWHGFTLSLTAYYIPQLLNAVGGNPEEDDQGSYPSVEDFYQLDGRLSYTFKGKTMAAAVESTDGKSIVDAKSGGAAAAPGAEVMSPVQKLLDGLTVAIGCNNMTNQQPPFIAGQNSNTDLSVYDPFGQFVYFEIAKKF
jgi:iron complex outermembrane receptor protein